MTLDLAALDNVSGVSSRRVISPSINPNLLRWTEEFDNAVWTKTDTVVTADVEGVADRLAMGTTRTAEVSQVTDIAVLSGEQVLDTVNLTTDFIRYSSAAVFDSLPYTLSVEIKSTAPGVVYLTMYRSPGNFIVAGIFSDDDITGIDIVAQKIKLEQGGLTPYVHRTT